MPSTIDQVRRHGQDQIAAGLKVLDHTMRQPKRGEIGAPEAIDALLGEELTLREASRVKTGLPVRPAERPQQSQQ